MQSVTFSLLSEAFDEFTILANSWRYSQQYSSEVFFVKVDIDEDGMDAFQQVFDIYFFSLSLLV